MYLVPERAIVSWETIKDYTRPKTIDINCPHCSRSITFALTWLNAVSSLMTTVSRCTACNQQARFILLNFKVEGKEDSQQDELYMHPRPKMRQPIEGLEDVEQFTEALRKAYIETVDVYNYRSWTATAVLCRRLLEGVMQSLLPESEQGKALHRQLEALPKHRDLQKPLVTLAHAIRQVGNLGAHFDSKGPPSEETVTAMLGLLEFLLEYLFILPKRINDLDQKVSQLGQQQSSEDEAE